MKQDIKKESIPLIDSPTTSPKVPRKNKKAGTHCKGNDRINPVNYTVEHMTNLPFQIITAYDSSGAVTALGGLIVQLNLASEKLTTGPVSQELTLLALGVRIALTIANVAAESIAEQERYETETRQKKKVDARYCEMCQQYSDLLNAVEGQLKNKKTPNWSTYNAIIFSIALSLYAQDHLVLSEHDEHLFYSVLQYAIPAEKKSEVFDRLREFKSNNTEKSRLALEQAVTQAFKHRVKPNPIIKNKKIRSLLRNLKRALDFLLSNATGISLVTILASYIALLPFITVVMFPVYIVAVSFGVVFSLLEVARDIIERKHQKFATKVDEQKSRYKQSQLMKKLLSHLQKTFRQERHQSTQDSAQASAVVTNDELWRRNSNETLQVNTRFKQPWSDGGSLFFRTLITMPMTLAIGAVTGWWAVLTVTGIVVALGGPALSAAALLIVPAICAGIVAIYFLVKSFANHYRDYHLEHEDIRAITKEWEIHQQRHASNKKLRDVTALPDAELLETYIKEYLREVDPNNPKEGSKEFFHNIQQMIGVKFSEAKESYAFYSYLATKVLKGPSNDPIAKNKALMLVSQLKAHMERTEIPLLAENRRGKRFIIDKNITLEPTFIKKPLSFSQRFKSGFDSFSAIISPVVMAVGLAVAFASGPALPIVASVLIVLLGLADYLGAKIEQGYQDRKKERNSLRARMMICDETSRYLLRSDHEVVKHKEIDSDKGPSFTKSPTLTPTLSSPNLSHCRFSFNESPAEEGAPLPSPAIPFEEEHFSTNKPSN